MGREVKRVALDFDWPMGKPWGGFINPFSSQSINCPECDGSGSSSEARRLKDQWYGNAPFRPEDRGSKPYSHTDAHIIACATRNVERSPEYYGRGEIAIGREAKRLAAHFNNGWCHHLNQSDVNALVDGHRLFDFTHTWTSGEGWKPKDPPYIPTAAEVNVWSCCGIGHDAINQWIVVGNECRRLGLESKCKRCDGEGTLWPSEAINAAADNWKDEEPPVGEGWQIWETVSEGSPITPVFPTREGLIAYLIEGGDGWDRKRGAGGWTPENAESFVAAQWAPSMIAVGGHTYEPRDGDPT
jgi:hypothetical protein